MTERSSNDAADIAAIERPRPELLRYYLLSSLAFGPLRYRTIRYRFDDEGVSMSWGVLFRHEIHLNFERIQDIHLTSNAVERWFDLARIQIQTASGAAKAEMTLDPCFPEHADYAKRSAPSSRATLTAAIPVDSSPRRLG